jgi:hypothetical protein
MKLERRRILCKCRLAGRAHYAVRCPGCGYCRRPEWIGSHIPSAADLAEARRYAQRLQARRRAAARELLQAIERSVQMPIPPRHQLPRARPPADLDRRPWRAQEGWAYRAAEWEAHRAAQIERQVRGPFELADDLARIPPNRRYLRAAQRMLAAYADRLRAAGWEV